MLGYNNTTKDEIPKCKKDFNFLNTHFNTLLYLCIKRKSSCHHSIKYLTFKQSEFTDSQNFQTLFLLKIDYLLGFFHNKSPRKFQRADFKLVFGHKGPKALPLGSNEWKNTFKIWATANPLTSKKLFPNNQKSFDQFRFFIFQMSMSKVPILQALRSSNYDTV